MIYIVKGFGIVYKAEIDVFWNSLAFSMIQRMLAIWSLVTLPFLKPSWTSGSSWFSYCWSLVWPVQFSHSVVSDSLRLHESQHTRPPCPSPTPGVHSKSRPSSHWCHPAISSSVAPFSFCPQSLPASESFPMSQLFAWGGQSIGVSALASVLPIKPIVYTIMGFACTKMFYIIIIKAHWLKGSLFLKIFA